MTALQGIAEDDFLRARFYGLLAVLMVAPPPEDLLRRLAAMEGDSTPLGTVLGHLSQAAAAADSDTIADEFATLFVGVTGGEIMPYGSWYLTGFLHEKPLADLRDDMARLGIEPSPGVSEPEDHAASLCEMMQGLVTGLFNEKLDLTQQKIFFQTHLGSWMPRFLADLEKAPSARFYRSVAEMGRVFLEIETQAFAMVD
ncbi:putative formate dehydrogenase-specific chaperone [Paramagnetospirillum magnetotacticum MS-1]|uniref:Putative formate dehydrogenase-specific chaperone n=1 Tax=Paramagnetospirillum magnetotacticum MS-1 TaxID=272627 RepID=A0A0C2UB05_PARME|nr:putative formate dehydrogenase-specific chaperone [Paramagnetospirillum magnetotacticum MS-1]